VLCIWLLGLTIQIRRLEKVLSSCSCWNVSLLSTSISLNDLAIFSVQKRTFLETKLAQVSGEKSVLFFGTLSIELDSVSTDPIKSVDNNEVMSATNLVFQATGHPQLN